VRHIVGGGKQGQVGSRGDRLVTARGCSSCRWDRLRCMFSWSSPGFLWGRARHKGGQLRPTRGCDVEYGGVSVFGVLSVLCYLLPCPP